MPSRIRVRQAIEERALIGQRSMVKVGVGEANSIRSLTKTRMNQACVHEHRITDNQSQCWHSHPQAHTFITNRAAGHASRDYQGIA